jgi:hypothetical protein
MSSFRPYLLALSFLAVALVACGVDYGTSPGVARDRTTTCEPDSNTQCLCKNGSAGTRHCGDDRTLGPCTSRGRACGNADDEETPDELSPTPSAPLPGPSTKEDGGVEAGTGSSGGSPQGGGNTCSEVEPNNEPGKADSLASPRCGTLAASDEDYFTFTGQAGTVYEVTLAATGDADMEVIFWNGTAWAYASGAPGTTVIARPAAPTTYYAWVLSPTRASQSYTISMKPL